MSTPEVPLATPDPVSLTGRDLHLSFGANDVLRGVDIQVDAGTTTTVIGPSGSGKSTLLRVLNRLHEPQSGDILIDGRSVLKDNPDELRRRIGMVFQQFNLFPHMTVADNIAFAPRKIQKLGKDEARELAMHQLELVGLTEKADVRPSTLSGGQQQRVAIARALAMKPQIMFFDEATSALDPELVKGVLALMTELSREGMTMVVVTHEMGYARNVSDSVLFMDEGVVVETGPPDRLFDDPSSDRLQNFLSEVL
ncbi:peptide ABC transporter ATP-binding protein [Gordonia iterans]|uniref:Peptide ABC transporter ATP-binding protein n=1 Tax=Gordonia iterans TaxID=1004901 RepID=A0A2S0KI61_9ACTN|nr:amino acid ABC transporter ATP-binding protein [Gordonia iterans]AVM01364.1 peptide ABC transporter ATP-binding protein [Gordonia iterans]